MEKCQQAFDTIKDKVAENCILKIPEMEKPFVVTCDASGVGKSNSRGLKCKGVIASVHMVNIGIGVCLRVC